MFEFALLFSSQMDRCVSIYQANDIHRREEKIDPVETDFLFVVRSFRKHFASIDLSDPDSI